MKRFIIYCIATIILISLHGCSAKKHPHQLPDGAPKKIPAHLLKTPDPIPRVEPLSKYGNRFKKGTTNVYITKNRRYHVMPTSKGYRARGKASWYGTKFHGRKTSSGEPYDMFAMTAAHTTLPLPSYVKVTNLHNRKSVIVKVNDRGPFHSNRLLDLSYVAAAKLGLLGNGTTDVEIESVDPRDHGGRIPKSRTPFLNFKSTLHADAQPPKLKLQENKLAILPPARIKPSVLYLQIGSFTDRSKAEALAKKISVLSKAKTQIAQTKKISATTKQKTAPLHILNYQVRIGPMKDTNEINKISKVLANAKLPSAKVIKELP